MKDAVRIITESTIVQLSRARSMENHKHAQNHYSNGKGLTHLNLMLNGSQNDRNQHGIGTNGVKENRDPKSSSTMHLDVKKTYRGIKETIAITMTIAL